MIPSLLPYNYFDTLSYSTDFPEIPVHGDIDLIDCIECFAEQTEDDGSEWELAFSYPKGGYGFDSLKLNAIILAKANPWQGVQAFRIYGIEKQTKKTVTVKAEHISYDLAKTPAKTFKATSATDAMAKLQVNSIYGNNWKQHHFKFSTDISSTEKFEPDTPVSMRAMLLDGDKSIKGTYGGDLIFDNYSVQLKQVGGEDRDVTINYGVDLVDLTQEQNNSEMVTGILPYYKRLSSDELYATQPIIYGDIAYGPGTYETQRIEPVDLSEHFPDAAPTVAQLNAKAAEWVAKEEIGEPEISLTVSYANIGQDVRIHDAVRVRFPSMGVDVKAKVVKYKYNVLLERCEEIEVGHAKESKYFNLMDASRLRKGLVPPERIQNESITNEKIARGGVGKGKIGQEAIGKYNIELGAIDHDLLAKKGAGGTGGAVQADVIDDEAVGTKHLAKKSVDNTIIKNKAVGEDQLDDGGVTNKKLGSGSVTKGKISDAQVSYEKLVQDLKTEIDKIDVLEANIASVNLLFATTAQVDFIRVKTLYATSLNLDNRAVYRVKVASDTDAHTGYWVLADQSYVR